MSCRSSGCTRTAPKLLMWDLLHHQSSCHRACEPARFAVLTLEGWHLSPRQHQGCATSLTSCQLLNCSLIRPSSLGMTFSWRQEPKYNGEEVGEDCISWPGRCFTIVTFHLCSASVANCQHIFQRLQPLHQTTRSSAVVILCRLTESKMIFRLPSTRL